MSPCFFKRLLNPKWIRGGLPLWGGRTGALKPLPNRGQQRLNVLEPVQNNVEADPMDDILHHPYKDFLDLEEFLGQMDLEGHLGPNGGQVLQHNRKPVPIRDLVDDIRQEVGDLAVDDGQVRRIDGGQELGDVLEAAQDNVEAHLVRNIVDDAEKDFLNIGNDPLGLGLGPNRRLNRQEVAQNSVEAHPIGDVLDNVENILLKAVRTTWCEKILNLTRISLPCL